MPITFDMVFLGICTIVYSLFCIATIICKKWSFLFLGIPAAIICGAAFIKVITDPKGIYNAHLNSRPKCDIATSKCLERHIDWVKDSIKYAKAVQKEAMAENEKVIELKAELELLRKGNQE
jgi:hypothetical protein